MINRDIDRRRFFGVSVAAVSSIALSNPLIPYDNSMRKQKNTIETGDDAQGILELDLYTHKLEEQGHFYANLLNLPVKRLNKDTIQVLAGATKLRFRRAEKDQGAPAYHFAFNIPENKIYQVRDWLLKRTKTLKQNGREIFDFRHWDAHAVYFHDPAGNVAELIAHHKLKNATSGPFTEREIIGACEIALVVDDVPKTVSDIYHKLEMNTLDSIPAMESFAAVGTRHRMLIIMKRGRRMLSSDVYAQPFAVTAHLSGETQRAYPFENYPFVVTLG